MDLPFFIENTYIFNIFLSGNIFDDVIDVFPGIEHHGIVGPQKNGVAQAAGFIGNPLHGLFLFIGEDKI